MLRERDTPGQEVHLAFILRKVVTVFSPLAGIRCHNLNGLVWTQEMEKAKGVRAPNRKAALLQASMFASQKRLKFFALNRQQEFKFSDVVIYSKNKKQEFSNKTNENWVESVISFYSNEFPMDFFSCLL